jgi:hypothetical protein
VALNLTGAHHAIRIHFLKPGCSRWTYLQAGEVALNGEVQRLVGVRAGPVPLAHDPPGSKNRTASVFFDGKFLYRLPYTAPWVPSKASAATSWGAAGWTT